MTTTVYAIRFDTRYLACTFDKLETTDDPIRIRFFKDIENVRFCMAGYGYYKGDFDIVPVTITIAE